MVKIVKKINSWKENEKHTKDRIENKIGLNVLIEHRGVNERSKIFCDKIGYMHDRREFEGIPAFDHHLMFYNDEKLVFKVWLKNDSKAKEFKNVNDALKSVGINIL